MQKPYNTDVLLDHKWIDRRKHLNPAFKHDVLLSFFHIFDAETNILRNKIESYVDQGEIELVPDMLRWSFRIAARKSSCTRIDLVLNIFGSVRRNHNGI